MNEQEVYDHLQSRIPQDQVLDARRGGSTAVLFGGGIAQKIFDALKELVGTSGIDVDVVIAAAKKYYDEFTAGDNPSIPNIFETIIERLGWAVIERSIRRLFACQPLP